jgi:hypothetical protein
MLALFGVTFVAVFVLTSLFIWRGAIRTIPAEPIGRQDRRPDSERLAVQTVDGPGKMLMRRARYREILDDATQRSQLRPMDRLQEQEIAEAA